MHKLIIKPFAEEDALEAAIWYNNVKKGLGNEYLLDLEAKINSIQFREIPITFKSYTKRSRGR